MTKNYFIELADYNIWANNKVHSWFEQINDEQWEQPVVSSFKSIAETAVHTAGAEKIWLERLNHLENPVFLTTEFKGSKREAIKIWKNTSVGFKSFVENLPEADFQTNLAFKRVDGNTYELLNYQVLAHVFNHSSYHRGQLVTMLRQVGFTSLSSIDFSSYIWSIKK